MPKLTFYPLGNADCCLIDLADGQKLLIDYAHVRENDQDDKRIDLRTELERDLEAAARDYYDVVAFTHLDLDHTKGAGEFFWFDHAKKYQGVGRKKIQTLWVPAAAITETELEEPDAKIIQAEAQHRLKEGYGIRVFSRPERLGDWLQDKGLSVASRDQLMIDAGQLVWDYYRHGAEGVEFFVHSPHARRMDDGGVEDRNGDSLVFQAVFLEDGIETKALFASDIDHEVWADIVDITCSKGREERLEWDVYKLPHHCSYRALGLEKGVDKTEPTEQVAQLCEEHGQERSIIVSTSEPIPSKGSASDNDKQPPHRQAANYYKEVQARAGRNGEFKVTMEHPSKLKPEPVVILIDSGKAKIKKAFGGGATAVISQRAPRAG